MLRGMSGSQGVAVALAILPSLLARPLLGTPASARRKQNVIFILADNVGYGDLGAYGGGNYAALQLRALISSQPRVCGLRNTSSILAAPRHVLR